jgi:hypothetical protein
MPLTLRIAHNETILEPSATKYLFRTYFQAIFVKNCSFRMDFFTITVSANQWEGLTFASYVIQKSRQDPPPVIGFGIMPLDGSPKKLAEDIASGLMSMNRNVLKRFTMPEIQKILVGIETVSKEIRSHAVDSGDFDGLKEKGLKSQRLNSALLVIRTHIKEVNQQNLFARKRDV